MAGEGRLGAAFPVPGKPLRSAPTWRLALLVFAAGLPLLWGWVWLAILLTGTLAALAIADLLAARRQIELVRKEPGVLSLGAQNRLAFELRSTGDPVSLTLKETLPPHLELEGAWPALTVGPEWRETAYLLKPIRRGAYAIGPLYGRYESRLRLWQRQVVWLAPAAVRVYPNLQAARQWELAIRQGKHLEGLKRARVRGTGTDFESLREYQPGDEYRAINWPATARSGRADKLVTTLYQVDRSQPVMLLVDAGRMMLPEVERLSKLDHALNAALLVGTVAVERGDQVGLMLFGGEVKRFMAPGKGRGHLMGMLESIYDVTPEQVEPDYGRMISWLRVKHKKRSLVVFFTDLMDPEISRGLIAHLGSLARQHLVLVVCLSDPELLRLAELAPKESKELYEKTAALEVLQQRLETKAKLSSLGIMVIDVPPAEFSPAVVNAYLEIKASGRL